jgi:hypothetical protein
MRFPVLVGNDVAAWSARVAVELERLLGELPVNGTVTLTASTTTTTVSNPAMTAARNVLLTPLTANAAAEDWHISDRSRGSFEITHSSDPGTDRDFAYTII